MSCADMRRRSSIRRHRRSTRIYTPRDTMVGVQREQSIDRAVAGKFRIVSQLGQGGTADVYLALANGPAGFRKLVVLKILRASLCEDQEFRTMFLAEARLAARLRHPNIVQTNEVLELEGVPAIVMEYLEGQSLSWVITHGRERGFTQAMEVLVLVDALRGLHSAHELGDFDGTPLGVVHRDVSPQNIFVTMDGQAKILDFGIAKNQRSLVETEVGTIKGRLRYMAPEQIAGEPLDRRADIYSAGVILWEALAGERMWKACSESEIRLRVVQGDVPSIDSKHGEMARICRKALSLAPVDRHANALDLADEIETALPVLGSLPHHRQMGELVASLFEAQRRKIRTAIEEACKTEPAKRVSRPSVEFAGEETPSPVRALASRPRARWLVAVCAVTLLAGLAFVAARAPFGATPRALDQRLPADSLGASASATQPATTDQVVASPGFKGGMGASPSKPSPRETVSTGGTGDDDRIPAWTHAEPGKRSPAKSPSTVSAASKRPARPEARALPNAVKPPAPRAHDCDHPFFFDANGIKKFRPECM